MLYSREAFDDRLSVVLTLHAFNYHAGRRRPSRNMSCAVMHRIRSKCVLHCALNFQNAKLRFTHTHIQI